MTPLRERLLKDDPVAHEPPLDAAGVERMRRQVLAAGIGRPRGAIVPWLARCAAVAVVMAIAAVVFGSRDGGHRAVDAERASERIDGTTETPSTAAAAPVVAPAAPIVAPVAARVAPSASSAVVAPITIAAAAPPAVPVVAGARLRQLHFTTPEGTRLVWLFDSDVNAEVTP